MPDFNDPKWIAEQQALIAKAETTDYKTMCFSDYKKLGEEFRRACIDNYPAALEAIVRLQKQVSIAKAALEECARTSWGNNKPVIKEALEQMAAITLIGEEPV